LGIANRKTVWTEGLFIRPQHFQQQSRYFENTNSLVSQQQQPFGWGFSGFAIDPSSLLNQRFALSQACGLFADGTPFVLGDNALAPEPVDLNTSSVNDYVFLCIKSRCQDGQSQEFFSKTQADQNARYCTEQIALIDSAYAVGEPIAEEMAFSDELQNGFLEEGFSQDSEDPRHQKEMVEVGVLKMHLIIGAIPPKGYEALAMARVMDRQGDAVVFDPNFIPPVMDLNHAPRLNTLTETLMQLFGNRIKQIQSAMGDFAKRDKMSLNVFLFTLLNRSLHQLAALKHSKAHPVELYRFLMSLKGEMSALLSFDQVTLENFPVYDHAYPTASLNALFGDLTKLLDFTRFEDDAKPLPLEFFPKRQAWVGRLDEHNTLVSGRVILMATSEVGIESLTQQLPRQVTICAVEHLEVWRRQPQMIHLKPVERPNGVQRLSGWQYFQITGHGQAWQQLLESEALAIHVDSLHTLPSLEIKVWMVPNE